MNKPKAWSLLTILASCIILAQGIFIVSIAGPTTIEGVGSFDASTVQLVGASLLIIGAIPLILAIIPLIRNDWQTERAKLTMIFFLIQMACGFSLAAMGIYFAFNSGPISIEGFGSYPAYYFAAFCGQLTFFGLGLAFLAILSGVQFCIPRFLTYFGGLVVASEGVVIIGVADPTFIEGLGGIMESTVVTAGMALFALGALFLICSTMIDLASGGRRTMSAIRLLTGSFIVIIGLAITVMATNVTPEFIGTLTTPTITIAGIQLAFFGGIALLMSGARNMCPSTIWGKLPAMGACFLMMLIPAAYFTVGKFW